MCTGRKETKLSNLVILACMKPRVYRNCALSPAYMRCSLLPIPEREALMGLYVWHPIGVLEMTKIVHEKSVAVTYQHVVHYQTQRRPCPPEYQRLLLAPSPPCYNKLNNVLPKTYNADGANTQHAMSFWKIDRNRRWIRRYQSVYLQHAQAALFFFF